MTIPTAPLDTAALRALLDAVATPSKLALGEYAFATMEIVRAAPSLLDRLEAAERDRDEARGRSKAWHAATLDVAEQRNDAHAMLDAAEATAQRLGEEVVIAVGEKMAAESALSASRAEVAARAQGNAQDAVLIRALRGALEQVKYEAESFHWSDGMPAKAGRVAMQIVAEVASRALAEKGDGK